MTSPSLTCARTVAALGLGLLLGACSRSEPELLGTLEWDRIAVLAEASEPVLSWQVQEGALVQAVAVLLELDPRRLQAQEAQAQAQWAAAQARLDELVQGARSETLSAARAQLARAQAAGTEAEQEYRRVAELKRRQLIAQQALDQAQSARQQALAATQVAEAQWQELARGTRREQLVQASAQADAARAQLELLRLSRERLTVKAPRAGRVDALPFKPGDQAPLGATVASLLVGDAPYARVFIPASQRAGLKMGDTFQVTVQGVATPFQARLHSLRSEPSFTPYYALQGDDASRLAYRAELRLEGEAARRLPAGLPLRARRQNTHQD